MKNRYLDIMEHSLEAYSTQHIQEYFQRVKTKGLTEHGFPRLTANMGILIARGRKTELLPLFCEMMDFCCANIPVVHAANDFSVREVMCCLAEVEAAGVVEHTRLNTWKAGMASIVPETCYDVVAKSVEDEKWNWALFTGVSEFFRQSAGLCESTEFIETQVGSQLKWLDENGMYMDKAWSDINHPMTYDMVSRALFCLLLHRGYRGKYYSQIDEALRKAGLLMLKMQSITGEVPFGGRSNQFLMCEAWFITLCEFEANRYAALGDLVLAGQFKAAAAKAADVIEYWLSQRPIRHIKNFFPVETMFGCEVYAYFDKYMITTASNLYGALILCDDSIAPAGDHMNKPIAVSTSYHFHKVFLRNSQYAIELDTDADDEYDARGLGRVHRIGAPSAICLSVPCPSRPSYKTDMQPRSFSIAPALFIGGRWVPAAENTVLHTLKNLGVNNNVASAQLLCAFPNGQTVAAEYLLDENGVNISLAAQGVLGCALPAFSFDGTISTEIQQTKNTLHIFYKGYVCRYTVQGGVIEDMGETVANRNGHYRAFMATGADSLKVHISIEKA